ncbi:methylated-DNA--[protein]-cysteine S-methyltransferase [Botrimarina sp.]|uniref:methylated-DNA--[protein]-cysteine S-methyltransferase n=1 Tax=Botrimarina sp. TaxID=2795802 RepID=UPI0032EC3DDD
MTPNLRCVVEIDTPVGPMTAIADESALLGLDFGRSQPTTWGNRVTEQTAAELAEYFAGERQRFGVPLELLGTPFQRLVWSALLQIPYGQTRSYRQLAVAIGAPTAARAVGNANGRNPIAILTPCHRVVRAGGELGGYGGGVQRKRHLLEIEAQALGLKLFA